MKKQQTNKLLSRRNFLKKSCASIGAISSMSALSNLVMTKSAMAAVPFTDYKALVCLFQHGGNDSYNMLMPYETDEHLAYQTARSGLASAGGSGLALDPVTNPITDAISGRRFGIHESMPEVKTLYDTNKLAFLANVGTLVQPTTLNDVSGLISLPAGLYSHSDQQLHWHTSKPDSRTHPTGWTGRMLNEIDFFDGSDSGKIYRNIALKHTTRMQTADTIVPYVVGTNGATRLAGYGSGGEENVALTQIVDGLTRDASYSNILESTYADTHFKAISSAANFNNATSGEIVEGLFPANTPGNDLGSQLKKVAQAISARGDLGVPGRQIFYVEIGGWDMHDYLLTNHGPKLGVLSQSLGAFAAAMEALGLQDSVTTFTASDFARTLSSNGDGSDHGWGGNHIVMGGAVDGGKVFGDYPTDLSAPMSNGGPIDTGRGRLIPTTSVDELYADLALWYGIPFGQIHKVLPNLTNFYTPGLNVPPPVGLFKQV